MVLFKEVPRGKSQRVHHKRRVEQVHEYSKYQKWAELACGVPEAGWRQCLEVASATHKDKVRPEGIPECLRRRERATVRTHAITLCRIKGLLNAVAEIPPEISSESFNAQASTEVQRILALSQAEVDEECSRVPVGLTAACSFDLQRKSYKHCGWVAGLFSVWLRRAGAILFRAEHLWDELLQDSTDPPIEVPRSFALDGVDYEVRAASSGWHSSHLKRGEARLHALWWRLTWHATCMEVGKRHREQIVLEVDAQSVSYTMEDLYRKLYDIPHDADEVGKREKELMKLWHSLQEHERKRGRGITDNELGRFQGDVRKGRSRIDGKSRSAIWSHLTLAAKDIGWRARDDDAGRPSVPAISFTAQDKVEPTSIPREAVEELGDGWYKWRGYRRQAESFDDAYVLINAEWYEQQLRDAHAKKRLGERKEQLQRLEADDARYSRGECVTLTHHRYNAEFKGRRVEDGHEVTFVEDGIWYRVSVGLSPDLQKKFRDYTQRLHIML